jgi:hypothetical protein
LTKAALLINPKKMKTKLFVISTTLCMSMIINAQINAGYVDDFENNTTQNWTDGGSSSPPVNIPTGGPNGTNDNYLQNISLGGNGSGSKMVMFNNQQWNGNYTNQNILSIEFDVRALSNTLNLRIAFDGDGGRICTTNAVTISPNGPWTHVVIPITSSDFTLVAGGSNIAQTLSDVSDMRILSNVNPSWQGQSVSATLEIDNIRAASTVLGTNIIESVQSFELIPNPDSNYLNISLASNDLSLTKVNVYDSLGKLVYNQNIQASDVNIPVTTWNSGIYIVQVSNDRTSQVKRFIKI